MTQSRMNPTEFVSNSADRRSDYSELHHLTSSTSDSWSMITKHESMRTTTPHSTHQYTTHSCLPHYYDLQICTKITTVVNNLGDISHHGSLRRHTDISFE